MANFLELFEFTRCSISPGFVYYHYAADLTAYYRDGMWGLDLEVQVNDYYGDTYHENVTLYHGNDEQLIRDLISFHVNRCLS